MVPTCDFRWFRAEDGRGDGTQPMAKIEGVTGIDGGLIGDEWFILRQRWVSAFEGEPDEWRAIEVVP